MWGRPRPSVTSQDSRRPVQTDSVRSIDGRQPSPCYGSVVDRPILRENAKAAAGLLRADNVTKPLLVTSALHLPRATRLVRQQGVEVIPVGCDYHTDEFEWGAFSFFLSTIAVEANTAATREWLSTLVMIVRGE